MTQTTMPRLTLLLGPAGCGKTHRVIQEFAASLNTSDHLLRDDLLFILPTAEHRERIIDLVLRQGQLGFFHKRITTFDRSLRSYLNVGHLAFVTDASRLMILREILVRTGFRYFKTKTISSGFLELIAQTITELKENLIRPEELRRRLALLAKRFPEFEPKYLDLDAVFTAYDQELEKRNLIDQRDALQILEAALKRGEFNAPELDSVWVDGFSEFSKLQLAFIEFLARHSQKMTVTLTMDQDPFRKPLFEIVSETRARFEEMGFCTVWQEEKNWRAKSHALAHLSMSVFSEGAVKPIVPDESIQVFEATGISGELELIAREIRKLVRGAQYYFSDIAVILRNVGPYASTLQSIFSKYEIPYEFHERERLRLTPIARTLQSFFAIFLNDWTRVDLLNFLKSSYVSIPYELVCELELTAYRKGIFKDRAYWLSSFPEVQIFRDLAFFEDRFLKLSSAQEFVRWVKDAMNHFGLLHLSEALDEKSVRDRVSAKRILLLLSEFEQKHRADTSSLNACHPEPFGVCHPERHVLRVRKSASEGSERLEGKLREGSSAQSKLHGAFNKSSSLELLRMTQDTCPPRNDAALQFADEFLHLMGVDLFSLHSRDKNKVQIYNVSVARQKEYKAIFLPGLLEKEFPVQIKEDPIFSDRERRELNQKGEVLRERLPRQAFERYLFYLSVSRARERLILSYPRFNLEGKEALPSFYVEEVRKLFNGELHGKKQLVTDVLPKWEEIETLREAEANVIYELWRVPFESRKARDAQKNFSVESVFHLYNYLCKTESFRAALLRLFSPIEGVILDPRVKNLFFPKDRTLSPTRLEEYGECSYRYFAHRLLHLESQTDGIDIRRRGIVLHSVLEQFFKWWLVERKGKVSLNEARNYCLNQFQKFWDEQPLTGERYYKIELERKRMEKMILQVLRREMVEKTPPLEGLTPTYFEQHFEDFHLKGEGSEFILRGVIDRIDLDPSKTYALVIDYKTGKQFASAQLANGTSLQLPLYLSAIQEKLGLKPLGGHLYSLSAGASSGFHHKENLSHVGSKTRKRNQYSKEEFEDVLSRAAQFAAKYANGIEQAQILVRPRDCVSFCSYSGLCRIEKWRLKHIYREIKKEDESLCHTKSFACHPERHVLRVRTSS